MFDEAYRRELELMGPDREQMERLKAALNEGKRRTRPLRRSAVVAVAVCAVLAVTAVASSPTVRDALDGLLGGFAPYAQAVDGAEAVDRGIRVRVVKALTDADNVQVYLEVTDLTGDRLGPDSSLDRNLDFRAYDPDQRTGLVALSQGYSGSETPEEMHLRYHAVCVGERRHFEGVALPEEFGLRTSRALTEAEQAENWNFGFDPEVPFLVLEPGQTPADLGSDLFSLSSMGFDEAGSFHVQLALAEGLDARLGRVDMLDLTRDGQRVGAGRQVVQFTQDGRTYADLGLEFQRSQVGPEDADGLAIGPLKGSLQAAAPILGEWALTFPVERVESRTVACGVDLGGGYELRKLTLSLMGLKAEGPTSGGVQGILRPEAALILKSGERVELPDVNGGASWTWEDNGIATSPADDPEAYEANIHNDTGYFDTRWRFDDPVNPADVAAVVLNGRTIPLET